MEGHCRTPDMETGSHQFQREYIEYLQGRNSELLNKLSQMKENYDNKIFSKDLNKQYIISVFEDVLKVCSTLPQEIDLFFDKMTAAMGVLTNLLIKKSEMLQLVDRISHLLSVTENITTDSEETNYENFINRQIYSKNIEKKGGMVKVSPMVNGHVISTDPRICLNRVPEDVLCRTRNGSCMLSPIIETSPDNSDSPLRRTNIFKELRAPLQKLCFNKFSYKTTDEVSPKTRLSASKILSPKEKSALKLSPEIVKEKKNIHDLLLNKNSIDKKKEDCENYVDPLEGPSWLYDDNSAINSPSRVRSTCYVDFRRRKHRFATMFEKNLDSNIRRSSYKKKDSLSRSLRNDSKKLIEAHDISNKEITRKIDESFQGDSISESTNNENNNSCSENSLANSRKCIAESSDDNDFDDFAMGLKNDISTPYSKKKVDDSSLKPYLSNDKVYENKSFLEKSSDKHRSRLSLSKLSSKSDENSKRSSFKNITPISGKRKKKKSVTKKSVRKLQKQKVNDLIMEKVVIKLEDCKSSKEFKAMLIRASNSGNKDLVGTRNDSWSPFAFENEGRKKRKAAPTNLTEPKLTTKLRRG